MSRFVIFLGGLTLAATALAQQGASIQVNVTAQGADIPGDAANEPSIAVDPLAPNRMVIGWRQFDTITSNFRQAGKAYSNDGGRTWQSQPPLTPGVFRSDPVLACSPDGVFHYLSLTTSNGFTNALFSSADGTNWSQPVFAFGGDKAWFIIDQSEGPGRGNMYETWSTCCAPYAATTFTRSTNAGLTFETPITIPTSPVWGTLTLDADGALYIVGATYNSPGTVRVVKCASPHAALPEFTGPFNVPMDGPLVISQGPNPAGLLGQIWIVADTSSGPMRNNIYVLATIDPPPFLPDGAEEPIDDPADILFSRSTDGGQTWSSPIRINDDAPDEALYQWFGTMSIAPNGRLDVIWNDTRSLTADRPTVNLSHLRYRSSFDGGLNWSPSIALSGEWNSFTGWPRQNKIGDYYHMTSDDLGADLAWAATFRGGQDVYYLRIGERDCNRNGVADVQDILTGAAADCNGNGLPDSCEIAAGAVADADLDGRPDGCPPPSCAADWNGVGGLDSQDFFDFLEDFFAMPPDADFNGVDGTDSQDYFDFVEAFIVGC